MTMTRTKTRDVFGQELAVRLFEAEKAIDKAIAAASDLSAYMTRGRIDHDITAVLGQDALNGVAETGRSLVKARGRLLQAHEHLERDARSIGIRWKLAGPLEDKPKAAAEAPRLRQVA